MQWLIWLVVLLAAALGGELFHICRQRRELDRLSKAVEHFLLYPEDDIEETLNEGAVANLQNAFSELTAQFSLMRAASAHREEEMTHFVENIAHQIKNAATALQIRLDILQMKLKLPDEVEALKKSQLCMNRLTDEVDRVLKSSQLASGKITMVPEKIDLSEAIKECCDELSPLAEARSVELLFEPKNSICISADAFWLPQAISNIIKNAVEHTARGTAVNVIIKDCIQNIEVRIEDHGAGIPEDELPLKLPELDDFRPAEDGSSALARATEWIHTTCPKCGAPAEREIDTMPNWAGSSWYYIRYCDPHNDTAIADKAKLDYWLPVDWYNGGMEHTTLHLLYSRFWHKFLYDIGVVSCPEPYMKRTSHGMILAEDGRKMSKSFGNVINPDDLVNEYGADTVRMYEMFIGAFDQTIPWSTAGVKGCRRFLDRVWKLQDIMTDEEGFSKEFETKMHQTIKKVSFDYENLKYNTAIAQLMTMLNDFSKAGKITRGELKTYLILLNPVAPHITEEMWEAIGENGRVYQQTWPEYDEAKTVESTVEIAVQINGKTKATINIAKDADKDSVIAAAKEALGSRLSGNIIKEIYVPGRIVNIVAK